MGDYKGAIYNCISSGNLNLHGSWWSDISGTSDFGGDWGFGANWSEIIIEKEVITFLRVEEDK